MIHSKSLTAAMNVNPVLIRKGLNTKATGFTVPRFL